MGFLDFLKPLSKALPFDPIGMAQLAFGGIQMIKGAGQEADAARLAAENPRPVAHTADLYSDLVTRYAGESQYGIDRNARTFANENINNNFTAGLSAMLMAGGNPNSVSSLYSSATNAGNNLAVQDSERRWQKVNAMAAMVEKQNDAKIADWQYNEDAPFKDKARLSAQKEMMGYNQKMTGMDYAMGALIRGKKHFQDPDIPGVPGADNSFTPTNTTELFQGQDMDRTQANAAVEFNGSTPNAPFTWQSDATPVFPRPTGTISFADRLIGANQRPMADTGSGPVSLAPQTGSNVWQSRLNDIFNNRIIGYDERGNPKYR